MSGGGLESTGVAFATLSLDATPGRGVVALDEPPIAWPDHPLAASGGEILATRVLPLMGHNARDFARAAAVCRGWRAACRAAAPTLIVYREMALHPIENERNVDVAWSPCGKLVATTAYSPPRFFIWRASTGAVFNECALATPTTAVPSEMLLLSVITGVSVAFSRDSARVLTHFNLSDHFAVWSVPDGQLIAVNTGDIDGDRFICADFGVPGSASDGLAGFGSYDGTVHLWDISPPPEGGEGSPPRLQSRVDLAPGEGVGHALSVFSFAFSPDGSKFVAAHSGVAYVYDVASLTRLGAYTSPSNRADVAWASDGRHVLGASGWGPGRETPKSAFVWDFSRPEAPSVVTVGPDAYFRGWSHSGSSFFVTRKLEMRAPNGPAAFVMEERRAADGSLIRDVSLGPLDCTHDFFYVVMSPDSHALVLHFVGGIPAPRVVVFD